MKTYVVNLARAEDRRAHMEAQFRELGFDDYEFFEAVDGRSLDLDNAPLYNRAKRLALYGIDLTQGEVGCYLSHYEVIRRIYDSGVARAFVLEDDMLLHPRTFELADKLASLPQSFEFIRLGGMRVPRHLKVDRIDDEFELRRLLNVASEMSAYVISREGAAKILAYGEEMIRQIDATVDRYWESDLAIYALHPYPVRAGGGFDSTIGNRIDVWKLPGKSAWRWRTRKLKQIDGCRKRLKNLKIVFKHLLRR